MKEPEFSHPNGYRLIYSEAPSSLLQEVVHCPGSFDYCEGDVDFRRRYAAILLRERLN